LRGPEPLLEVFRRLAAPAGARPSAALNSGWPGAAPAPGRPGAAPTPGRSGALPAPGSAGGLSPVEARTLPAKFRIRADVALRPADTLPPGERPRAGLALFQARGSNCLILDEPTNHLDLPAIEQLEQALTTYQGTLLLVTHDRRLAANVAITRELDVT